MAVTWARQTLLDDDDIKQCIRVYDKWAEMLTWYLVDIPSNDAQDEAVRAILTARNRCVQALSRVYGAALRRTGPYPEFSDDCKLIELHTADGIQYTVHGNCSALITVYAYVTTKWSTTYIQTTCACANGCNIACSCDRELHLITEPITELVSNKIGNCVASYELYKDAVKCIIHDEWSTSRGLHVRDTAELKCKINIMENLYMNMLRIDPTVVSVSSLCSQINRLKREMAAEMNEADRIDDQLLTIAHMECVVGKSRTHKYGNATIVCNGDPCVFIDNGTMTIVLDKYSAKYDIARDGVCVWQPRFKVVVGAYDEHSESHRASIVQSHARWLGTGRVVVDGKFKRFGNYAAHTDEKFFMVNADYLTMGNMLCSAHNDTLWTDGNSYVMYARHNVKTRQEFEQMIAYFELARAGNKAKIYAALLDEIAKSEGSARAELYVIASQFLEHGKECLVNVDLANVSLSVHALLLS